MAKSSSSSSDSRGGEKGPLLVNSEVLNTERSRLNEDFEQAKHQSWYFASADETHATSQDNQMRVEEASSRYGDNYLAVSENHLDIVKPRTKNDSSYLWLIRCLKQVFDISLGNRDARVESFVLDSFVRLKEQEDAIKRKLQEVAIVGLVGMGGIGKTTLAKATF